MRPHETEIPERTQSIAARIFSDVMEHGEDADEQAAGLLIQCGIQVILECNRFGLQERSTILNGRVPRTFQIVNFHECIWNAMEGTLRANERFGEQTFAVLNKS